MAVTIVSNHHREVKYNSDTLNKLSLQGYPVILNDTKTISYDQGMVKLCPLLKGMDIIAFIDNDLWMSGTDYFEKLLEEFERQKYDFLSYPEAGSEWEYPEGLIVPVPKINFLPTSDIYRFKPQPHFENAFLFIRGNVWDKFKTEDVANSRNMVRAVYEMGAKMGVHKAKYKLTYSHYGPQWFHVGNLMKYYYVLEQGDFSQINFNSDIDCSRIGFFIAQKNDYGNIYTSEFDLNLKLLTGSKGEKFFLDKWYGLYTLSETI